MVVVMRFPAGALPLFRCAGQDIILPPQSPSDAIADDDQLRCHHRRRRRGGLRPGKPAVGAFGDAGASPRSRPRRPPGAEPADILDSYPRSYYNDAYFWPGLKVHWRRKDNSPLTGFSQGRGTGGGSTVMGMVAYRGTPDDYAEWQAQGAAGWGWDDVLPYFRKLENDRDFDGALHGKDGPVPIRRTRVEDWAPLSKAVQVLSRKSGRFPSSPT